MKTTDLTDYIKHYLEKDKTQSAIMLTGSWGAGKSHYILNNLIPTLSKEGANPCIVISLFGLNTLSEISKSIYLELRAKMFKSDSEKASAGKIVAKIVVKGIAGVWGIDLNADDADLQKLYSSIDLKGKLLIFEDIERSQIGILPFMGYVNSLVEQDGVKVLLVANEDEILTYTQEDPKPLETKGTSFEDIYSRTQSIKIPTAETIKYLATKEKTVSDTILFENDFQAATSQILKSYHNDYLNRFLNTKDITRICGIFESCENTNLRSFIFACQKCADIFDRMEEDGVSGHDLDFIRCIFLGVITFSLQLKEGKTILWRGGEHYSVELGTEDAPLFKFCFDYIVSQKWDPAQILPSAQALKEKRLYDQHKTEDDPDLRTLVYYHVHTEAEVRAAVRSISSRLENVEDISFFDYGTIAFYLVIVKNLLGCDIENAKNHLVENLQGHGNKISSEALFSINTQEQPPAVQEEYNSLRKRMAKALLSNAPGIPDFDYLPEQSRHFYRYVSQNEGMFRLKGRFAKNLDMARLAGMFSKSTPQQKNDIRRAFTAVYTVSNIKQFISDDAPAIYELRSIVKTDMENQTDRIQALQYKWFWELLDNIVKKADINEWRDRTR